MKLHPRTITDDSHSTRRWRATIDPREFKASTFIAQVADGWIIYTQAVGSRTETAMNRVSMIRSLGAFLDQPGDDAFDLRESGSMLVQRLIGWERSLIARHRPRSMRPQSSASAIKLYVGAFLTRHNIENLIVQRWVKSRTIQYGEVNSRIQPLNEFSNKERLDIEKSLRNVVRSTERLLEIGDELVKAGEDPRKAGWDHIPNLVWALHHLPMDEALAKALKPHSPDAWWDLLVDVYPEVRRIKPDLFGHPIIGLAIPHLFYLQSMRLLLVLRTGWPPEEILALKDEDIEFSDSVVRVRTQKRRAAKIRHHELSSPQEANKWGWKPGDLFRRADHAMRRVKKLSPENEHFWIGAPTSARPLNKLNGLSFYVARLIDSTQFSFSALLKRTGVSVSSPIDVRRLRKTHKSAKAILLGTLAGSAGDDHSIEVFRNHYAQSTTVHTVAARTVLQAQDLVMSRIGPNLVMASATQIRDHQGDQLLDEMAEQLLHESPVDSKVSVASCINPTAPPHSDDKLCLDGPQLCLTCPNALIFRDHLPRLVSYQKILQELEKEMSPRQFAELYGQQMTNIDAILAQFPSDVIHTVSHKSEPIRVPLTMRQGR